MEASHSNGTHGRDAIPMSGREGPPVGSAFAPPVFSPGAASPRYPTRRSSGQRRTTARPAAAVGALTPMNGGAAAPLKAAASENAAMPGGVLGSVGLGGADAQGQSRQESRPVRPPKAASPQKGGRRVRPAWVSGVQPDDSDSVGSKPAAAFPKPEVQSSFVFSGFAMGTAGDQNASPDKHRRQDAGKTAAEPPFSFGTAGMRGSFGAQPAGSRISSGVSPSPKRVPPQAPLAAWAAAERQASSPRASPRAPEFSEPLLSRQFAGFTLGRAPPPATGFRTPSAANTLAGAFQRASINDSAAVTLADRFAGSVRVDEPAAGGAQTPSAAAMPNEAAAAQPAVQEPTPSRGGGFTFGGRCCCHAAAFLHSFSTVTCFAMSTLGLMRTRAPLDMPHMPTLARSLWS